MSEEKYPNKVWRFVIVFRDGSMFCERRYNEKMTLTLLGVGGLALIRRKK